MLMVYIARAGSIFLPLAGGLVEAPGVFISRTSKFYTVGMNLSFSTGTESTPVLDAWGVSRAT